MSTFYFRDTLFGKTFLMTFQYTKRAYNHYFILFKISVCILVEIKKETSTKMYTPF